MEASLRSLQGRRGYSLHTGSDIKPLYGLRRTWRSKGNRFDCALCGRRLMPQLNTSISPGLWRALRDYAERVKEPLAHIVSKALAEYLQVPHHTLYQVSTATALVEGIYQGAVRVGTLREHGDLGLGTFENLDGEMVIVDGHFFQVRSDGSVRECDDDVLSPFAVITRFAPEPAVTLDQCPEMSHLTSRFDTLRHSDNAFFALRVDGQ